CNRSCYNRLHTRIPELPVLDSDIPVVIPVGAGVIGSAGGFVPGVLAVREGLSMAGNYMDGCPVLVLPGLVRPAGDLPGHFPAGIPCIRDGSVHVGAGPD